MMKIPAEVKHWLEVNISWSNKRVALYDTSTMVEQHRVINALHLNLIEYDESDKDVIYYRLTPQGEIALGISTPENDEGAVAAPVNERYIVVRSAKHGVGSEYGVVDTHSLTVVDKYPTIVGAKHAANTLNATPETDAPAAHGQQDSPIAAGDDDLSEWTQQQTADGIPFVAKTHINGLCESYSLVDIDEAIELEGTLQIYDATIISLRSELAAAQAQVAALEDVIKQAYNVINQGIPQGKTPSETVDEAFKILYPYGYRANLED